MHNTATISDVMLLFQYDLDIETDLTDNLPADEAKAKLETHEY